MGVKAGYTSSPYTDTEQHEDTVHFRRGTDSNATFLQLQEGHFNKQTERVSFRTFQEDSIYLDM